MERQKRWNFVRSTTPSSSFLIRVGAADDLTRLPSAEWINWGRRHEWRQYALRIYYFREVLFRLLLLLFPAQTFNIDRRRRWWQSNKRGGKERKEKKEKKNVWTPGRRPYLGIFVDVVERMQKKATYLTVSFWWRAIFDWPLWRSIIRSSCDITWIERHASTKGKRGGERERHTTWKENGDVSSLIDLLPCARTAASTRS